MQPSKHKMTSPHRITFCSDDSQDDFFSTRLFLFLRGSFWRRGDGDIGFCDARRYRSTRGRSGGPVIVDSFFSRGSRSDGRNGLLPSFPGRRARRRRERVDFLEQVGIEPRHPRHDGARRQRARPRTHPAAGFRRHAVGTTGGAGTLQNDAARRSLRRLRRIPETRRLPNSAREQQHLRVEMRRLSGGKRRRRMSGRRNDDVQVCVSAEQLGRRPRIRHLVVRNPFNNGVRSGRHAARTRKSISVVFGGILSAGNLARVRNARKLVGHRNAELRKGRHRNGNIRLRYAAVQTRRRRKGSIVRGKQAVGRLRLGVAFLQVRQLSPAKESK